MVREKTPMKLSEKVEEWSSKQVAHWLTKKGFQKYSQLMCNEHDIDGMSLLAIQESDLIGPLLQIKVLGDVKRLIVAIRQLQHRCSSVPIGPMEGITQTSHQLHHHLRKRHRNNSESSEYYYPSSDASFEDTRNSGKVKLKPELWKTLVALFYFVSVTMVTAIVMVIVHDRVPDMQTYPPLPDIFLDNVPLIPWAFAMCELTGLILFICWASILLLHKHRFILLRRMFALFGSVFLLRCVTMIITSLSVPGKHLECKARPYGDWKEKVVQALIIWLGGGMSIQGVRSCGDYMFSGHTVALTLLNFFITEYSPRRLYYLHTITWVLNLFGIFFILAAHEHYSIDVFIAFYISTRLFLYYHTLANNRALMQDDSKRTRIWFPLFYFFESGVCGTVPNEYEWPLKIPASLKQLLKT